MLIIFDACAKIYCQLRCQSYIVEVNKFTIIHTLRYRKVRIWFVIIIRFFSSKTVVIMMSVRGSALSDGSLEGPILNF